MKQLAFVVLLGRPLKYVILGTWKSTYVVNVSVGLLLVARVSIILALVLSLHESPAQNVALKTAAAFNAFGESETKIVDIPRDCQILAWFDHDRGVVQPMGGFR